MRLRTIVLKQPAELYAWINFVVALERSGAQVKRRNGYVHIFDVTYP